MTSSMESENEVDKMFTTFGNYQAGKYIEKFFES